MLRENLTSQKPLAIDLFCGLGGWAEGFLAEDYDVIGFDIESWPYPGQLVLQDVLTLHGSQFRNATVIVCSPPCQAYSYRAMPWKRAKALGPPDNTLFDACFRIQREASEAAGRKIPLIVENVKGAQKWVGRAKWHYGSFYLWGDVPALMPMTQQIKGAWDNSEYGVCRRVDRLKLPGNNSARHWEDRPIARLCDATKNNGGSWFAIANNTTSGHSKNPVNDGTKNARNLWSDGKGSLPATTSSHSFARKQASVMIAKIPFSLAQHIARVFKNGTLHHQSQRG